MPFLLPALSALVSDSIIAVFLGRHPSHLRKREQENGETDTWIYATRYLSYLAFLRIILLLFPLLFHSYTGTALRCSSAFHLLYWGTLLIVLIQIIGLAFLNPESLEALLPRDASGYSGSGSSSSNSDLFYDLRRLWWMLSLTLLSNICHLILLVHVRSTAPMSHNSYDLLNRAGGRRAPSLYFQLRQYSRQNNNGSPSSSSPSALAHSDDPFLHTMSDFMEELQARLRSAKLEWSARLDDFTTRISASSQLNSPGAASSSHSTQHHTTQHRSGIMHNPLSPMMVLTPFRVLLQLFAYHDVLDNGKLDTVFDLDEGVSLTFWVPQLLSFLLHGALETSPKLEEWILNKCRSNIQFAHRCYWFLRAWCLEAPLAQQPSSSSSASASGLRSRNASDSHLNGIAGGLSPFLDEPAVVQTDSTGVCNPKRAKQQLASEKFSPEERALIERLMLRVKECGEVSAKTLAYGRPSRRMEDVGGGDVASPVDRDDDGDSDDSSELSFVSCQSSLANGSAEPTAIHVSHTASSATIQSLLNDSRLDRNGFHSPSKLMHAVENGLVPINPSTGFPSVRHLDVISAHHKFGFLPLDEGESRLSRNPEHGRSESELFDRTPHFLDSLLFLADRLFEVPTEERRGELRKQLRVLECELLPDNAVYMPIGNTNHRVWRIVPEESIPLGTKERVPCIVTLEVVAYKPKKRKPVGWNFLPKRTHHTLQSSSMDASDSSPTIRRPLVETLEMDSTESELLAEWRYGRRDPFRRTAFFDKVTGTVKDATDKMSAQMRDRINLFRERSASDEMKSLKMADAVVDGVDALASTAFPRADHAEEPRDIEASLASHSGDIQDIGQQRVNASPALSRNNSSASLASMGQWSSPHPKASSSEQRSKHRRRILHELDESESSSLPYGSDNDSERAASTRLAPRDDTSAQLPSAETSKHALSVRPPVVFRESWQTKESRIRQKSAFGSKPGWRLLPVLIKANDDLRQEQLASQLIYRMAAILAREKVNVWLCPYEIIALTDSGGIIEAIPDTISLDSLKRNDANFTTLKNFFISHYGTEGSEEFAGAQANFAESLAAYSIVCYLLQLKDRHNGNILLDNRGHVINIDFGFFFLSSPGSNVGFESAPFKLTRDFVDLLGGPQSRLFRTYRELCYKTFITLRRHCMEIILMVEMLKQGNEELNCFRGRPDEAIRQLRERFRLDLNDRACRELVNCLIDDSIENWRTDWYDRYQRYFVGVL